MYMPSKVEVIEARGAFKKAFLKWYNVNEPLKVK
jgi:hypothetical protein